VVDVLGGQYSDLTRRRAAMHRPAPLLRCAISRLPAPRYACPDRQHHPVTGIDVAIFGQGRAPNRTARHKLDIARHRGSNHDLFARLDGANLVLGDVALDLGSILRLDLNRRVRRARGYGGGFERWPFVAASDAAARVSVVSS